MSLAAQSLGKHWRIMIRILIADDHAGLRTALRMVLELEADFHIVGEAADGDAALNLALASVPDIIVADMGMPGPSSIELVANLRSRLPFTHVVMVGHDEDALLITGSFRAGAKAYVNKEWINEGLATTIRDAADCRRPIPMDGLFDQSLRSAQLPAPCQA
jgi:DNA-binding NarL/FixJ family response regulator